MQNTAAGDGRVKQDPRADALLPHRPAAPDISQALTHPSKQQPHLVTQPPTRQALTVIYRSPVSALHFPHLDIDGSRHDELTAHQSASNYPTPPAALSSLGVKARMASHPPVDHPSVPLMAGNDEQYDMIDDLSEISNDDHETASISSEDSARMTPELGDSMPDLDDILEMPAGYKSTLVTRSLAADSVVSRHDRRAAQDAVHQDRVENLLLESVMSEDMDTPTGSIMPPVFDSTIAIRRAADTATSKTADTATRRTSADRRKILLASNKDIDDPDVDGISAPEAAPWYTSSLVKSMVLDKADAKSLIKILLFTVLSGLAVQSLFFGSADGKARLAARRLALSESFPPATDAQSSPTQGRRDPDIEHLLPESLVECFHVNAFGIQSVKTPINATAFDCATYTPYDVILPNHLVIALPGLTRFPQIVKTRISTTHGQCVNFTQRELVKGVHEITFDPDEVRGSLSLNMVTRNPSINITLDNYNHHSIFKMPGQAYQKMTTDVGKLVSKDLTLMRHAAHSFTNKMSDELAAGTEATKSVARSLSQAVVREAQIFGNAAASVLVKAVQAGNNTAATITKDFVVVQRDVVKFTKDITARAQTSIVAVTTRTRTVLDLSRERLLALNKAIREKKEKRQSEKQSRKAEKVHRKGKRALEKSVREMEKAIMAMEKPVAINDGSPRGDARDHRWRTKAVSEEE